MAVHSIRSRTPSALDVGLQPVAYGHAQRKETNTGYAKYIGRVSGLAVALGVGIAVATTPGIAWADDTASASSAETTGTTGATGTSGTSESDGTSTTAGTTPETTGTSTTTDSQTGGISASGSGAVDAPNSGTSASTEASVRQAPPGMVLATGGKHSSKKSSSDTSATGDVAADSTTDDLTDDITAPKPVADSTATDPEAPVTGRVADTSATGDVAADSTTDETTDDTTAPKPVADSTATEPEAPAAGKAPVTGPGGDLDKRQQLVHERAVAPGVEVSAVAVTASTTPSRPPEVAELARTVVDGTLDEHAAPQALVALSEGPFAAPPAVVVARQAISAAPVEPTPPRSVSMTVLGVLASLGPLATDGPVPFDSPLGLALMAVGARPRQVGQAGDEETPSLAGSPMLTSQSLDTSTGEQRFAAAAMTADTTMMMAATSAPSPSVTQSAPDDANGGTVTGSVSGELDGNTATTPTYTLAGQPTGGTVELTQTGTFTYTPSQATRLAAASTPGLDTDSFTVTVSDGQATPQSVTVTAPISSTQLQLDNNSIPSGTTTLGGSPSAVVVGPDGRMYVSNTGSGTVSVIDTNTGQLIDTNTGTPTTVDSITVGTSPSALLLDGNRLYVANTGSNTVSVIDTTTYKLIDTNPSLSGTQSISVGSSPSALALGPDGRLYVANTGSNTVSVIDTTTSNYTLIDANPKLKGTQSISVGTSPSALALGADGKLYVANRGSNTVSVIDTTTKNYSVVKTISGFSQPSSLAVNTGGSRVYVVNSGYATVSVIDTTNGYTLVDTNPNLSGIQSISVGSSPSSVKLSRDGTLAFVANSNDTISVIDTRTNTVTNTLAIDPAAPEETGGHVIAVDGTRIYVTDAVDRKVRTLSLVHVNTAPQVISGPTVGTANPDTGAVDVSLIADDIDGDKLTYSIAPGSGPTNGTVTYDAAANTYTYTPTAAAREAAAQPDGEKSDRFTITISDGQGGTTNVDVTVAISPQAAITPIAVSNPTGVAVIDTDPANPTVGKLAYVAGNDPNSYFGTVSVIDAEPTSPTYNQVVDTIGVGYAPTRVAASPTGEQVDVPPRVYVATYDSVWVIDADPESPTTFNTVIATIDVPNSCSECYNGVYDVVVSPEGTRVYAARGDGTISVIGTDPTEPTTYHQVISTANVGLWDGDIEITPDGNRLYVAHISTDSVAVLDSETLAVVDSVDVGPQWDLDSMRSETTDNTYNVAVSPDGTRAYVTERVLVVERGVGGQSSGWFISDPQGRTWLVTDTYSAVSVIDTDPTSATYNQEIARITVPDGAYDVAVSDDGMRVYVTHSDGKTVTVIDTGTNAVVDTFTTDDSAGSGTRAITVGRDGTLYITDYDDNTLYISSFNTTV